MAKKTTADPTGQRDNRARTTRRLQSRLNKSQNEVLRLFRDVPRDRRVVTNAQTVVYSYDLTAEQLQDLNAEIRTIVNKNLETSGDRMPPEWWYQPEVEQPTRQGTLEELNFFNQLIAGIIAAGVLIDGMRPQQVPAELILSLPRYLASLRNVYIENFATIKNLSSHMADQVIQRLNTGIRAGLKPSRIAEDIKDRFEVGRASAKRIAETEVNRAYNDAKLRATKLASDESGLDVEVKHISALTSTTRESHAARHGKNYTVEEQQQWWDSGTNRINCKCTTETVLVGD